MFESKGYSSSDFKINADFQNLKWYFTLLFFHNAEKMRLHM